MFIGEVGFAFTTNYVDPDFIGTQSGTASQPWSNLTASAWSVINSELSNGPVTVYFSARKASNDTDQVYDTIGNGLQLPIDLIVKTNTTGNLLTLDGCSLWNTNDTSPSWLAYLGTSKCVVQYFNTQNAGHVKHSDITVRGFKILCNVDTKIITICGDNFTLDNCDCSQTVVATSGPGVLIVPTADAAHEGSVFYAPQCTNINIISNVVHDTSGEAIYVGGGGSNPGEAGSGYPSHGNITVSFNTISNAGKWGGQGDGIDVKGGIYGVTIRGNDISSLTYTNGIRAIVSQGQTNGSSGQNLLIERNYIHDCTAISSSAIDIVDSWGVPQGVVIRNNIIANIDGPGSGGLGPTGISIATCQDQQLVQNNTIYNCRGAALADGYSTSSVKWRNNLLLNNNTNGPQVSYKNTGTNDSDYNAYSGTIGFASEGAHSFATTSNVLVSVGNNNFYPVSGSAIINTGETQSGFSNDYLGVTRPQGSAWDIGAYEYFPYTTNTFGTATLGKSSL